MSALIHLEKENRLGTITLNRPEKRNAMSPQLVDALLQALEELETDPSVNLVVLKAQGKAFCAGADLGYLQEMQQFSYEENLADSEQLMRLFDRIYSFPKLVIAQVQGSALAGGCGLVTVCDFAFATPAASFGFTEVRIGFVPALVSVFLVEQLGFGKAQHLLLSGSIISAQTAQDMGLITEVVEEADLEQHVLGFCQTLLVQNSSASLEATKRLLRGFTKKERETHLKYAAQINAESRGQKDCIQGIAAFLNKEIPRW